MYYLLFCLVHLLFSSGTYLYSIIYYSYTRRALYRIYHRLHVYSFCCRFYFTPELYYYLHNIRSQESHRRIPERRATVSLRKQKFTPIVTVPKIGILCGRGRKVHIFRYLRQIDLKKCKFHKNIICLIVVPRYWMLYYNCIPIIFGVLVNSSNTSE